MLAMLAELLYRDRTPLPRGAEDEGGWGGDEWKREEEEGEGNEEEEEEEEKEKEEDA